MGLNQVAHVAHHERHEQLGSSSTSHRKPFWEPHLRHLFSRKTIHVNTRQTRAKYKSLRAKPVRFLQLSGAVKIGLSAFHPFCIGSGQLLSSELPSRFGTVYSQLSTFHSLAVSARDCSPIPSTFTSLHSTFWPLRPAASSPSTAQLFSSQRSPSAARQHSRHRTRVRIVVSSKRLETWPQDQLCESLATSNVRTPKPRSGGLPNCRQIGQSV
jgi:hypothetical protein